MELDIIRIGRSENPKLIKKQKTGEVRVNVAAWHSDGDFISNLKTGLYSTDMWRMIQQGKPPGNDLRGKRY